MNQLSPVLIQGILLGYFILMMGVAYLTSRNATNDTFFIGNRNSNWLLVAFGMIGTSLSGVTFISVPGTVGDNRFMYFQVALGYWLGYFVVAFVLLPLYYRLRLTSIYNYLQQRFGDTSYKTGALFFIISRTIGATCRLYLVIYVLQQFVLAGTGLNFYSTAVIILVMILLYTFKGGVKTIVWTDTLQTTFMLLGLLVCVWYVRDYLQLSWGGLMESLDSKGLTQVFNSDINDKRFFLKQIIGGAFITITMTGLDQEMMQKNISVNRLRDSQKNMILFSLILLLVNLLFLVLGGSLYLFAASKGLALKGDDLFPTVALQHLPPMVSIIFIIGLVSALFPSVDGAITALTSSFCIDILGINRNESLNDAQRQSIRLRVHLMMAVVFFVCVIIFKIINDRSVIDLILDLANYTYGPLLGLFSFGILSKRKLKESFVPFVCLASPIICFCINKYSTQLLGDFKLGFLMLLLNGGLTFLGLWAISKKDN